MLLFAARYWYFGEWLPNTYYLKNTGVPLGDRLQLGITQGWSTLLTHFSIVLTPIVLAFRASRDDERISTLIAIFAMALLYTIYIGGDTWEQPFQANRFLSATTPLLIAVALRLAYERVPESLRGSLASSTIVCAVGL